MVGTSPQPSNSINGKLGRRTAAARTTNRPTRAGTLRVFQEAVVAGPRPESMTVDKVVVAPTIGMEAALIAVAAPAAEVKGGTGIRNLAISSPKASEWSGADPNTPDSTRYHADSLEAATMAIIVDSHTNESYS